jgi:hypothetical protein
MSYWRSEDWLEKVLVPVCRDRNFLRKMSGILKEEDFKPRGDEGLIEAYWIAQAAFKYWRDYRTPIGGMLQVQMLDYVRENKKKIGKKNRERLFDLVDKIRHVDEIVAIEAIEKKVIDYKRRREKAHAIKELIRLQEKGELDDKTFDKICRRALDNRDNLLQVTHYNSEEDIDKRIKRRQKTREQEFPALFIDCIDNNVRTFPRGEYGLVLAKYNIGKSTAAVHISKAYAFQGYNVLFFTLEDPAEFVEDRFDASLSSIPMKKLVFKSSKLRRRLRRALGKLRGRIKIVDGTDGSISIQRMEEIWENFRNQGFTADVIVVDYDEGVAPAEHYKSDSGERREMMEVHKSFKRFISRNNLWGWMLAQTVRGKSGVRKMIVTGDDAAIDISKVKRSALGLGIGDGPEPWGEDGRFLFIMRHRYDKARKGWPIAGDYKRATFYDSERTEELINSDKHDTKN